MYPNPHLSTRFPILYKNVSFVYSSLAFKLIAKRKQNRSEQSLSLESSFSSALPRYGQSAAQDLRLSLLPVNMKSRLLLGNGNYNNSINKQKQQQQQLQEIHRHIRMAPSSKRSKRAAMKRVVSIPIKGAEGSYRGNTNNNKSGDGAPPADCWAWRKYGQKPIKGSPYPRGYYRCSSSKGCPARKQVERSHVDPTMLLITYSSDHNHSLPALSRNQSTNEKAAAIVSNNNSDTKSIESGEVEESVASLITLEDEFEWLSGLESVAPSFMMMGSCMLGDDFGGGDHGVDSMLMPVMREEDLSLFADLEELPECSAVFRRKSASEDVLLHFH